MGSRWVVISGTINFLEPTEGVQSHGQGVMTEHPGRLLYGLPVNMDPPEVLGMSRHVGQGGREP